MAVLESIRLRKKSCLYAIQGRLLELAIYEINKTKLIHAERFRTKRARTINNAARVC